MALEHQSMFPSSIHIAPYHMKGLTPNKPDSIPTCSSTVILPETPSTDVHTMIPIDPTDLLPVNSVSVDEPTSHRGLNMPNLPPASQLSALRWPSELLFIPTGPFSSIPSTIYPTSQTNPTQLASMVLGSALSMLNPLYQRFPISTTSISPNPWIF
ncbi:hypothetical protein Ciccas_001291 [Cichlidogyrus casuarinus]|uniref:Uncharacterized protein n=1 Tax=Cichlidogyrus casuarinus TaxID=1844966 RepID=A0ABD2QKS1_9PLAT